MEISRGRRAPYTQVAHWVTLSTVSRPACLLYQVLSMHVNYCRGDEEVWPSRSALAEIMGYATARRVDPLIAELEALGAIDVERRKDDKGGNDTNKYLVHETPPPGYVGACSLGDYYLTRRKTAPKAVDNSEGVVSKSTLGVVSARTLGVVSKWTPELEVLELEELKQEELKNITSVIADAIPDTTPSDLEREDIRKICDHFNCSLVERGYKPKPATKADAAQVRLMLDADKRSVEEVLDYIDWVTGHDFWSSTVRSLPKFRAQFNSLRLQRERRGDGLAPSRTFQKSGSPVRSQRSYGSGSSGGHQPYRNPVDQSIYKVRTLGGGA